MTTKKSEPKASKTSARAESVAESVDDYLKGLVHPFKAEIVALRSIIVESDQRITDGIKWNAPSFYCHEWFATFNLRAKDSVQIIFHRGAKAKAVPNSRYVDDPAEVLRWITNDRCSANFSDLKDVKAKAATLRAIVAQWVKNLSDDAKAV